ncbi:MAG TPA: xanthine dehydrogenase family protein molybdopterin-binding subunit [Thermomicrobiales bacterium]|nr:xanthine dehydrogenase family protein molybdopterin-binding subunit [Thermomicrobiales bacterium]
MVMSKMVGARVRRKEDPRLITGSATYVDDVRLPGMLHTVIVRSMYPHGEITGYDTDAALAMPGVVAVYTGKDLHDLFADIKTEAQSETTDDTSEVTDRIPVPPVVPLAEKKVRYIGQPVAVVVAETQAQAVDAAELVMVDIDPLDAVTDLFEAMQDGAPQLYDGVPNNIAVRHGGQRGGDVDAAFANAAYTIKERIRSQRVNAVPMEGRAVAAAPDPVHGLTVWTSTQAPHWNRNRIAKALGLPQSRVRCIAPEVGGGFGQKIGAYYEDYLVSAIAWKLRRPVKWVETRSENMLASSHGRNQWADVEAAADESGKITALRVKVYVDQGAWPKGLDLGGSTWIMATGCYDIPAIDYQVVGVYTNTGGNGAYRGAGRPEAAYYIERIVDLLADESGLDPIEIRRRNFIQPDQFPFKTLTGQVYDTGEYEKPLRKAMELIGYADLRKEQQALRQQGRYLGIGVATYVEICGFGPYESSTVRVEPSGAVTIATGISPHGQGQETTFAQMAADAIGANFDEVVVLHGDTSTAPQGNGTMGSRGTAVGGAALHMSLMKIRDKAIRIAAHILEAAPEDIELEDGMYRVKGVPDRGLTLADIAERAYTDNLPDDIDTGLDTTDFFRPADSTYPFGTHIAVVEVQPETGEVEIVRYVSVDDCGVIMSPLLVTGQVHGGLAQGIGQALLEEMHYDSSGELITGTLNDYAVPRAHHFPEFETHHTETPTFLNPMGVKGIGEAATIGATPAVANAVIDALEPWGITHLDIPATPQRVWKAIQAAEARRGVAAD